MSFNSAFSIYLKPKEMPHDSDTSRVTLDTSSSVLVIYRQRRVFLLFETNQISISDIFTRKFYIILFVWNNYDLLV